MNISERLIAFVVSAPVAVKISVFRFDTEFSPHKTKLKMTGAIISNYAMAWHLHIDKIPIPHFHSEDLLVSRKMV